MFENTLKISFGMDHLFFYNLFEIHQDLKKNSKIRVDLAAIKDKKKPSD